MTCLMMHDADCVESANPRLKGKCCRCGQPVQDFKPAAARRNVQLERDITRDAAKGAVDPTPLIEFAEMRAKLLAGEYVNDHELRLLNRDRKRDGREELADCRTHLVWHLEDHPDDDGALIALRMVCVAFDHLLEGE